MRLLILFGTRLFRRGAGLEGLIAVVVAAPSALTWMRIGSDIDALFDELELQLTEEALPGGLLLPERARLQVVEVVRDAVTALHLNLRHVLRQQRHHRAPSHCSVLITHLLIVLAVNLIL